jgi:hypothetical protein
MMFSDLSIVVSLDPYPSCCNKECLSTLCFELSLMWFNRVIETLLRVVYPSVLSVTITALANTKHFCIIMRKLQRFW